MLPMKKKIRRKKENKRHLAKKRQRGVFSTEYLCATLKQNSYISFICMFICVFEHSGELGFAGRSFAFCSYRE